jgi:ADP-ribosylglycohydrolase
MPALTRPAVPPKKKGPPGLDPQAVLSKSRGALLGLAVGDALGTTNEFRKLNAPPFPTLVDGPHTDMRGQGPFNLKPGQVTDDTQMACCIGAVLKSLHRYDVLEVAKLYAAWRPLAFDVGNQTAAAIDAFTSGLPPESAGRDVWMKSGKKAAGNGSLMRCAPIGVFFAKDRPARVQASLEDSAITHYDPRCQLACVALNGSIAAAITAMKPLKPDDLVTAATLDLSLAGSMLGKTATDHVVHVKDASEWIREDLALAKTDDPKLYGPEMHMLSQAGFVRVAFRLAFWELFHAPSFEAALIDVVNRGGDSDTNGAITGALLGAYYGEEQIPERWRTSVIEALSTGRGGPFWDVYHPRHLLGILG